MFAEGKKLGPNGLNWLKIHLVNIHGQLKKSSLEERINYADEHLEDIFDSADQPFEVYYDYSKSSLLFTVGLHFFCWISFTVGLHFFERNRSMRLQWKPIDSNTRLNECCSFYMEIQPCPFFREIPL